MASTKLFVITEIDCIMKICITVLSLWYNLSGKFEICGFYASIIALDGLYILLIKVKMASISF